MEHLEISLLGALASIYSLVKKETQGSALVINAPDRHSYLKPEKDNNFLVHQGVDTLLTYENKEFEHKNHGDIGYITQSDKYLKIKDTIEHSIIKNKRDGEGNRGVSPNMLMVEQNGHLKMASLLFANTSMKVDRTTTPTGRVGSSLQQITQQIGFCYHSGCP